MKTLKAIIENPFLSLAISIILLVLSLMEDWDTFSVDLSHLRLRVHHGVALFALFNIFRALPDTFEGIEYYVKSKEEGENTG